MTCTCPIAGYCPLFNREMTPRQRQICAGEILTPKAREVYRKHWADLALAATRDGTCAHLGAEVRQEKCSTCCGNVRLKVFDCELHGECTLDTALSGVACCSGCGDYSPIIPDAQPVPDASRES